MMYCGVGPYGRGGLHWLMAEVTCDCFMFMCLVLCETVNGADIANVFVNVAEPVKV